MSSDYSNEFPPPTNTHTQWSLLFDLDWLQRLVLWVVAGDRTNQRECLPSVMLLPDVVAIQCKPVLCCLINKYIMVPIYVAIYTNLHNRALIKFFRLISFDSNSREYIVCLYIMSACVYKFFCWHKESKIHTKINMSMDNVSLCVVMWNVVIVKAQIEYIIQ